MTLRQSDGVAESSAGRCIMNDVLETACCSAMVNASQLKLLKALDVARLAGEVS